MVDMGIKTVSREVVIGNKIKSIFIHKNLTVGSHRPWLQIGWQRPRSFIHSLIQNRCLKTSLLADCFCQDALQNT